MPRTPSVAPSAWIRDGAAGISFDRPSTWLRWTPREHSPLNDGPLVYLSTDPLAGSCASPPEATPPPPDSQGRACDWPLARLSDAGVLVTWYTSRILYPLPSAGEPIDVNGEQTRLEIDRPGRCAAIGGNETMSTVVPINQPTAISNVDVFACSAGAELIQFEADVRSMLTSAVVNR